MQRIDAKKLPEFDCAVYLDSEDAIAIFLADIAQVGDAALTQSAQEDVARARQQTQDRALNLRNAKPN